MKKYAIIYADNCFLNKIVLYDEKELREKISTIISVKEDESINELIERCIDFWYRDDDSDEDEYGMVYILDEETKEYKIHEKHGYLHEEEDTKS